MSGLVQGVSMMAHIDMPGFQAFLNGYQGLLQRVAAATVSDRWRSRPGCSGDPRLDSPANPKRLGDRSLLAGGPLRQLAAS